MATRNVGVVLAGGVGARIGLGIPKQLIKIAGRPIIEHTIAALEENDSIDEIIVMMTPGYLDRISEIVKKNNFQKVSRVLEGRGTRNETTKSALAAIPYENCNVVLHDAVRPLVSQRILQSVIDGLEEYSAIDVAIPSADTVIEVEPGFGSLPVIKDVPARDKLRRGQTPQAFRIDILRQAYARANNDPDFIATDDCSVVLKYTPEVPIGVVLGEDRNMKVTEPIDIFLADKLFQLTSDDGRAVLSDCELRARLTGKNMVVFGGSYGIGSDIANLAAEFGCKVITYSRSTTNTNINRRDDVAKACNEAISTIGEIDFVVNPAVS